MNWTDLGVPGAIVLISGALFAWYHRITQATIKQLETELRRRSSPTEDGAQTRASAEGASQQVVIGEGQARDITLSTSTAPSVAELEEKEERDKIRQLLDLFDRRAVHDFMHEEQIALMCRSLNELRVQIQQSGVATLKDPEVQAIFRVIREEIQQMVVLASVSAEGSTYSRWGNEIFDVRMMGMLERDFEELEPYYRGEAHEQARQRYQNIVRFVEHRLRDLSAPPDSESLARSMVIMYVFGAIDEVKTNVGRQLASIRRKIT
jgi:hypothetical protein